jgi:hypothetical protein
VNGTACLGAEGLGLEDSFQKLYSKELDLDEGKSVSPSLKL